MIRLLTVATLLLSMGQLPSQAPVLAPALGVDASHAIGNALQKPFPDIYEVTVAPDTNKRPVKNCADYLALGSGKHSTGSALNDASLRSLGATCVALDWLKTARPATKPAFQNFSFRQIIVRELPPELALAISSDTIADEKAASEHGESILKIEPQIKLRPVSTDEAQLIAPDWTARMTVYAHADFLGDGNEELLVGWQAAATGGTYKATEVFLLARGPKGLKVMRSRTP